MFGLLGLWTECRVFKYIKYTMFIWRSRNILHNHSWYGSFKSKYVQFHHCCIISWFDWRKYEKILQMFVWDWPIFLRSGADVISFDGQGVISYRFRQKKMKILKDVISLKFKTTKGDGILLHGEGQQGDYITLELQRAKLLLQINLGNVFNSIIHSNEQVWL